MKSRELMTPTMILSYACDSLMLPSRNVFLLCSHSRATDDNAPKTRYKPIFVNALIDSRLEVNC